MDREELAEGTEGQGLTARTEGQEQPSQRTGGQGQPAQRMEVQSTYVST